jgi:uncharacterized membrane protein
MNCQMEVRAYQDEWMLCNVFIFSNLFLEQYFNWHVASSGIEFDLPILGNFALVLTQEVTVLE